MNTVDHLRSELERLFTLDELTSMGRDLLGRDDLAAATATKASVAGYLAGLESAGRRTEGEALAKIFEKATGWTAQMWGPSIIGFGRYSYTYDSGRQGDMCVVGFSPRKAALSLYLHVSTPEIEALFAKLGKARRDVGCIYVNKLADIDLAVLEKFVKASKAAALKAYKDKGWPVAPA